MSMIMDRSFAGLIGFAKNFEKPASINFECSVCDTAALSASIGVPSNNGIVRSFDATLHPSSFGICKSRITRSGWSRVADSRASSPSSASNISYPLRPRMEHTRSRALAASSAIRIRFGAFWGRSLKGFNVLYHRQSSRY